MSLGPSVWRPEIKKTIGILGAGSFAREVFLWSHRSNLLPQYFFVTGPDYSKEPVIVFDGRLIEASSEIKDYEYVCGVSDPKIKQYFLGFAPKLIDAIVDPSALYVGSLLGPGSIVCPGAKVSINTAIGVMATINQNATVGHDCRIGDFFNIAPNASLSGNCRIGSGVSIGTCASVREKISICDNVTIGMGAVVVKDINEPGVYAGVPAKKIR